MVFDIAGGSQRFFEDAVQPHQHKSVWEQRLLDEARSVKASRASQRALTLKEIEAIAVEIAEKIIPEAVAQGVQISTQDAVALVLGDLSGLGPLIGLIAQSGIEDIAINGQHIYYYSTGKGWSYYGNTPAGLTDALRVLIDRAGQIAPTPDRPIADAMLQILVPGAEQMERKGLRVNFIMPPASPYGDVVTIRISSYATGFDLAYLCQSRLPPASMPAFAPKAFPYTKGQGVLTPGAANYLLSVLVHGGTLIVAGTTGSGKTFVASLLLQAMLDHFSRGSIRLFVIEDSQEIVLNKWDGNPETDTGNIIYTLTRPEVMGGPPPITMYDLVRAALRSRPHGLVIGEARGAEAWELIRAAATGHGHSVFTFHANSAEHVWYRFLQVVRSHPDASKMSELDIAQNFSEAVAAIVYIQRDARFGQVVREIVEVSPIVERSAARPTFSRLFSFSPQQGELLPTGNRPMRPGFTAAELGLPETVFSSVNTK